MQAFKLYASLALLLLVLLVYADFRGPGRLEAAFDDWWTHHLDADFRTECARPLPRPASPPSTSPTTQPSDDP